MTEGLKIEMDEGQTEQLRRINTKRQAASKNKKTSAPALVVKIEKKTRITQAASAAVLNAAAAGKGLLLPVKFRQSTLDGVEKTLDDILA